MPFPENKMLVGKSIVYLTIINIALNILVTVQRNVEFIAGKLKKCYLKSKQYLFRKELLAIRENERIKRLEYVQALLKRHHEFMSRNF